MVDLSHFDAVLFHSPFCKLVQKSMARLTLNDFAGTPKEHRLERFPGVDPRFVLEFFLEKKKKNPLFPTMS